ncbi:MAG TPA: transporter substrate-binding domain-containing protein [Pseudodesulfovibrio sp.]|nr:transporter substrate-binding domain-containing protein [Pseudodesulfovibrio sp.]
MRHITLLLTFLATLLLSSSTFAADPIVIFGTDCKPPKSWVHLGLPKGVLVDILHEIEARTGLSFDIRLMPWKRAYMYALEGRGGIFGLSKNRDRMALFDFSDVMYVDEMRLVVLKDREFSYHTVEDLKGMTLGVTRGASYGDDFDRAKGRIFTPSEDSGPISRLRMLLAGRIDAALIGPGEVSVRFAIAQDKILRKNQEQFVILDTPLAQDDNYIGFSKDSKQHAVLEKIDKALLEMQQDDTIRRIESRY